MMTVCPPCVQPSEGVTAFTVGDKAGV
jgi:hypothetical protein